MLDHRLHCAWHRAVLSTSTHSSGGGWILPIPRLPLLCMKKLCMGLMTLVITVMIIANIYWVPGTVLSTLRILTHWILTPSWESPILLHAYDDVWQFLIKLNTYHLAQPSCSYLFTQGEWKFTFIPKPYMNAYDNIIHTSEKLETTQISFNGEWIDKWKYIRTMEYIQQYRKPNYWSPCNMISFSAWSGYCLTCSPVPSVSHKQELKLVVELLKRFKFTFLTRLLRKFFY